MNAVLAAWNEADESAATHAMLACCGARRWAQAMVALRPCNSVESLSHTADEVWSTMEEPDWMEAFAAHPRIGERNAPSAASASAAWSRQEQSSTRGAAPQVLADLAEGNRALRGTLRLHVYCVCDRQRAPKRCSPSSSGD